MEEIRANPTGQLEFWMLLLLVPTLGVGSLALWFWRRSFIQQVGNTGIGLASGRIVPWNEVTSVVTRKAGGGRGSEASRMYVNFTKGRGLISSVWVSNSDELMEAVKEGLRQARADATRLRAHYVHRR